MFSIWIFFCLFQNRTNVAIDDGKLKEEMKEDKIKIKKKTEQRNLKQIKTAFF